MMPGDTCDWIEQDEGWETDCGHMYVIIDGTPEENDMKHCTFCGRKIAQYLGTEFEDLEDSAPTSGADK